MNWAEKYNENESIKDGPTTYINGPSVMAQFNNRQPNTETSHIRLGQTFVFLQTLN